MVPYNPYTLLKFNAHINVEICSTVNGIKYLYKYVQKGLDRAINGFQKDEHLRADQAKQKVSTYLEARMFLVVRLTIESLLMKSMLMCRML